MMTNTIVLLSGGLDSTAAMFWAREHRPSVRAVSIDYGQKHRRELAHAKDAAAAAWVTQTLVKLKFPWPPMAGDVLPGRNMAFLTVAAAQGAARGGGEPVEIVVGSCAADQANFPDCRPEFLFAAGQALTLGLGVEVSIVAPWIDRTKAQILEYASKNPTAWEWTIRSWSCYAGGDRACGVCNACKFRGEGFRMLGAVDPCL